MLQYFTWLNVVEFSQSIFSPCVLFFTDVCFYFSFLFVYLFVCLFAYFILFYLWLFSWNSQSLEFYFLCTLELIDILYCIFHNIFLHDKSQFVNVTSTQSILVFSLSNFWILMERRNRMFAIGHSMEQQTVRSEAHLLFLTRFWCIIFCCFLSWLLLYFFCQRLDPIFSFILGSGCVSFELTSIPFFIH